MSHKSLLHHTHIPGWKDTSSISTTLLFAHILSQWSDWQLRLNLCPESNYRVGWGECSIWARLQSHLPRNQDSVTGELQLHKASQAWPQTREVFSPLSLLIVVKWPQRPERSEHSPNAKGLPWTFIKPTYKLNIAMYLLLLWLCLGKSNTQLKCSGCFRLAK